MHTYYDVMRAEDRRSFLIENPIFVDAETMEPAEDRKDLAAASARVERCVEINQCFGCVDGAGVDAMIQHERAVKF